MMFYILLTIIIVLLLWIQRKKRMSILQRYGIPSLRPHLFSGNLTQYQAEANVVFDGSVVRRLGKICGYYFGAKPVIVVSDSKALECIQKNPNIRRHFLDRPRRIPGGINPDKKRRHMLGNLPVSHWRRMRRVLAPAFGSHNIAAMIGSISSKVATFMTLVDEKANDEIEFYSLFQYLTLDIISNVALGIDSDMQRNHNDILLQAVQAEFSKGINGKLFKLYLCLPELSPLLSRFRELTQWMYERFGWTKPSALWQAGAEAVERRRKNYRLKSNHDLLFHVMNPKHGLCQTAIVANTVLVYEAAYETTSSCLAFLVHILAHRPRCQKKIRREIRRASKYSADGLTSFTVLQSLKYLEACIFEALRLYPTQTTFVGRSGDCDSTVETESGQSLKIPKGVHVQAALYQIHRDKTLWKDPDNFRPERFLNEGKELLKSAKYQAFGHGPRECIGKAFALMTIKLVVGSLLQKYKLMPSERSERMGKITILFKTATMTPSKGSFARVQLNENRQP